MGTDLYKQDLGSIPPCEPTVARRPRRAEIPGSELGTRNRGISKQIYRAFARLNKAIRADN